MSEQISLKEIDGMLDNQQVDNQADSNVTEETPNETVTFSLADIDAMLDEGEKKPDFAAAKKASDALNGTGSVAKQPTAKTEQKVEQKNVEQQEQTQAQGKKTPDGEFDYERGEQQTYQDPRSGKNVATQTRWGKGVVEVEAPYASAVEDYDTGTTHAITPSGQSISQTSTGSRGQVVKDSEIIGINAGNDDMRVLVGWKFPGSSYSRLNLIPQGGIDWVKRNPNAYKEQLAELQGKSVQDAVGMYNKLAKGMDDLARVNPDSDTMARLYAIQEYVHAKDLGYIDNTDMRKDGQRYIYYNSYNGSPEIKALIDSGIRFRVDDYLTKAKIAVQSHPLKSVVDIQGAIGELFTPYDKELAWVTAMDNWKRGEASSIEKEYQRLLAEPLKQLHDEIVARAADPSTAEYVFRSMGFGNDIVNAVLWVGRKLTGTSDKQGTLDLLREGNQKAQLDKFADNTFLNGAVGGLTMVGNWAPAFASGFTTNAVMKGLGMSSGTMARIAGSTMLGRAARGAAFGTVNLPLFTYYDTVFDVFQNPQSGLGDVVSSFFNEETVRHALAEAPTGAVLSPMAVLGEAFGRAVFRGNKYAAATTGFLGESLAFAGSSSIKKWMEVNERRKKGEDVSFSMKDVWDCTFESVGTLLAMKAGHWGMNGLQGRANTMKNAKGEKVDTEQRKSGADQFGNQGMTEVSAFLYNPRQYAKEHGITDSTDMRSTALGKEWESFLSRYQKGEVKDVDANSVATAMWLIDGKAMLKPISYSTELSADGKTVFSYDSMGNLIEERSFKNREKAEKWQEELRYDAEKYDMAKLEAEAAQRENEMAMQRTLDTMFDEVADQIPSTLANGEPDPNFNVNTRTEIYNIVANTKSALFILNNVKDLPAELAAQYRRMVEVGTPFMERFDQLMAANRQEAEMRTNAANDAMLRDEAMKVLDKKPEKRSAEEQQFLDTYSQILRGKVNETPYIGTAMLDGRQVYVKNAPEEMGNVYYQAEDGSVKVLPAEKFSEFSEIEPILNPMDAQREQLESLALQNREAIEAAKKEAQAKAEAEAQANQQEIEEKKKNAPVIDVQQPAQPEPKVDGSETPSPSTEILQETQVETPEPPKEEKSEASPEVKVEEPKTAAEHREVIDEEQKWLDEHQEADPAEREQHRQRKWASERALGLRDENNNEIIPPPIPGAVEQSPRSATANDGVEKGEPLNESETQSPTAQTERKPEEITPVTEETTGKTDASVTGRALTGEREGLVEITNEDLLNTTTLTEEDLADPEAGALKRAARRNAERQRDDAIAYSRGEIKDKPENYDYWKNRLDLEEPKAENAMKPVEEVIPEQQPKAEETEKQEEKVEPQPETLKAEPTQSQERAGLSAKEREIVNRVNAGIDETISDLDAEIRDLEKKGDEEGVEAARLEKEMLENSREDMIDDALAGYEDLQGFKNGTRAEKQAAERVEKSLADRKAKRMRELLEKLRDPNTSDAKRRAVVRQLADLGVDASGYLEGRNEIKEIEEPGEKDETPKERVIDIKEALDSAESMAKELADMLTDEDYAQFIDWDNGDKEESALKMFDDYWMSPGDPETWAWRNFMYGDNSEPSRYGKAFLEELVKHLDKEIPKAMERAAKAREEQEKAKQEEREKKNKILQPVNDARKNLTYAYKKGDTKTLRQAQKKMAESMISAIEDMVSQFGYEGGTTVEQSIESMKKIRKAAEKGSAEYKTADYIIKALRKFQKDSVKVGQGRVELNAATLKDPVSREYLEQKMKDEGWSEEARKQFMQALDDAAGVVLEMGKRYKRLGDWNKMEILSETDEVDYSPRWRLMDRKGQWIPNRSAFKKNGEYPWNIDLGTLCTKRESFDALVQLIAEKGMAQNLGPTQIEAIKELLKENDFLTACDICFNETKRARVISYANQISNNWRVVSEAIGVKDKMVGDPIALTQEQRNTLHRMAGRGYKSAFQELIPESERRQYKGEEKSGNEIDLGITASMMQRIAKQMLIDPTLVGKLKPETLITTEGMDWFLRTYGGHTDVNGILASAWGSGTPKPIEGFNLYDPLSWRDDYDQKKENPRWHEGLKSRPSIDWLMNNGGFRAQSFTDYHPMLFLDYLQMFTDVGVRKLPMHIYTKVPALVKLFGGSGAKINMSLVPKVEDGVDAEHAGLKPDGKGGWEYAWDNDSFPIEEAFSLRQDPRFRGNVGIIAVGLSDAHILKMLDDPTIDQVIPYHKSGMPESVQIKTGLKNATDYTDQQTTGGKPKKAADFNFNEAVRRTGDPRKAASEYVKWCEMNGYTPKFEQFKDHPNYYKVLADFRLFDNEGKYSEQEAVNPGKILGDNWKQELEDSLNDKTMQEAVKTRVAGNEKLMKDVERLMSKQRMDGAVRDEMVKKLKGALGKDNVESLKQNEFFNALEDAYKQTMGAEQAKEKVEVLRTTNGVVYGFASGGKITLNENVFNAETPIHEFTHIWVKVAQRENAKLWKKGKDLLKQTGEWQEVMNDDLYVDIRGDEDAVASEVLARIVGSEGADYVRRLLDPEHKPLKQGGVYNQIKEWLREMFNNVRSLFAPSVRNLTYDEFVNMPLKTLFDEAEAKRFLEAKTRLESEGGLEGDVEGEGVELSVVKDPKEIERLEKEPVEYGYRNVSMKEDGTFRSPMADKLGKKGEKSRSTEPFKMNAWEKSDENPDLATDDGKINLIKPNGLGSVGAVDYNPYIHIRPTTLNKQFKNAWERNDLVYLKVAYPASELDKGYHAPKAKLSVGKHPWNGGELILSRWDKPMEIVPWEEVANEWVNEFKDRGVEFDIVPPKLLPILMERGVEILPPHKGMGKACNDAYQEKVVNRGTRYEEEDVKDLEDFKQRIIALPTEYFETKFERPVGLGEFRAAVVPKNVDKEIREALEESGLDVREYDPSIEGDRQRVTLDAAKSAGDVLFRKGFSRPRGEGHIERVTEGVERVNRQLGGNAKVVREADLGKDVPKNAQAWYDPNTGEVHVVAERVNGAEDASRAVWHEEIGHKAMSELLGNRYNEWLDDVHKLLGSEHADAMQRLREKYAKELEGKSEEAQNRLLADEWIAELAERGEKDLSTWQKVKGMFRNWLWKHFGVMLGDGDIDYMLHKALAERRKGYRSKAMMSIAERRRAEEGNAMAEQSRRYRLLDEENRAEAKSRARDLLEAERNELNDKKTQMEDTLNRALTVRRGEPSAENLAMSPKQRRELAASIERLEKRIDALNDSLAETDLTDPERVVNRAWDHVGLATEAEMLMQKAESLMKTKDILRNAGVKSVENLTLEQRKEYDRYLWNGKIADARLTAMRDARPVRPFEGSIDDNLGREPQYDDFRHPDLDRDDLSERDRSYLERKANDDYARAKAAWNRQKEQLIEQLDDYEAECNDWRMRQRDYMREIVDAEKKLRADWQTDYWSAMENNQEADALLHVADMTGIPLTSKHDVQTYLRELRYEHVRRQQHAEGEDYKFIKEIESMVDKAVGTGSLANKARKYGDRKQVMRDLIDMMEGTKEVTEEMKPIVKKIQQWFDDMFEWQVASGLVYAPWKYRQGYVPHLWNIDASRPDADAAAKIEKAGGLVPTRMNSPFMNERFYDTYEEGIQHGLVPKHKSIIDLIKEYSKEVNKAVSNRQALDILRFVKAPIETEVWVEQEGGGKEKVKQTQWLPIVIDAGEVPPKGVQYNAYKNSAFYKDGTPQFLILSPRYVKGTERNIYSMFGEQGYVSSKDAADSNLEKALGTADKAGQTVKQTNLSFSAFHAIALTEHMLGASKNPLRSTKRAIYDSLIESVITGKTLRQRKADVAEDAMSHFVKMGNSYDFDKSMDVLTKLADVINNPDNPEWKKFQQAKTDKERAKAAKSLIRTVFGSPLKLVKMLKKGNDFILWDMLHDGYKLSVWDMRSKYLRKQAEKKGWSEAELNRRLDDLGQTINDMFGGQHWELLNASPRTMRNLRLAFLSPDWNASWLRLWGRMAGMGKLRNDNFFRGLKNEEGNWQSPISGKAIQKAWKENHAQYLSMTVMGMSALMAFVGYSLMNLAMRKKDIEEELAKAEEMRKTDPNYKSPYEEEGIKPITWENFLGRANEWMLSPWNSLNDPGKGTYVYIGKDDSGRGRYLRPGKQMRELFELFLDEKDHLDLGAWYKAGLRKMNPLVGVGHEMMTGYSTSGWENKELTKTTGWERELNRLKYVALHTMLPMSIIDPVEKGDTDKMWWRMAYPVSKGMGWYKGRELLEDAIRNDDDQMVNRVRRAYVLNGMSADFESAYSKALGTIRKEKAKEEGYDDKTPSELFEMAAKSNDPKMREKLLEKAKEQIETTGMSEGKTAREAMAEYQQKTEKEGNYLVHCTAQDMEYDTHMKIFMKKAEEDGSVVATFRKMGGTIPKKTQVKKGKKVVDSRIEWKGKDGYTNADCEKFYKEHEDELIAYYRMNMFREGYNARIKEMKDLKGKEAEAKMKEIREYRNKWMQYASEYLDTTTWRVKKHKK